MITPFELVVCSCVDFVLLPLSLGGGYLSFFVEVFASTSTCLLFSLVSSLASHIFLYQKKPMKKKMGRNEREELNSHAA